MDSAVLNMLPESQKSSYGKSRFYGQVGFGLGSYVQDEDEDEDFRVDFDFDLFVCFGV